MRSRYLHLGFWVVISIPVIRPDHGEWERSAGNLGVKPNGGFVRGDRNLGLGGLFNMSGDPIDALDGVARLGCENLGESPLVHHEVRMVGLGWDYLVPSSPSGYR